MSGKILKIFWPPVDTLESAKSAVRLGIGAAVFSAIITALAATWSLGAGRPAFGFVSAGAYLDVFILAGLAFGIYREKRWAGVFGLIFFLFEKGAQIVETGTFRGALMAVALVLCYIASVRGLYALHRLRNQSEGAIVEDTP